MFYKVSFVVSESRLSDAINVLHDYGPVRVSLVPRPPRSPYPEPEEPAKEPPKEPNDNSRSDQ